jgi:DNA-binding NtrC family response regulator
VIEKQVVRGEASFMPEGMILILDADKNITWTLKTLLESENYPVVVVDTIDRAVKDFSKIQVAGFISEYRIENDCTLETIRELKRMCPETYVMIVTDKEMKEDEYEEMMQMGIDDYFLKPVPMKRILLHLQKGLRYRNRYPQSSPSSLAGEGRGEGKHALPTPPQSSPIKGEDNTR